MTRRGRPTRPFLDPRLSTRPVHDPHVHCTFAVWQRTVNVATRYAVLLAAFRLDGRTQCRALALHATAEAYGLSVDRVVDILRREKKALPPEWRDLIPTRQQATSLVRAFEASGQRLPREP
jgi:hypothetical protein